MRAAPSVLSPVSTCAYSTPRCNVFHVGPAAGAPLAASNGNKNTVSTPD